MTNSHPQTFISIPVRNISSTKASLSVHLNYSPKQCNQFEMDKKYFLANVGYKQEHDSYINAYLGYRQGILRLCLCNSGLRNGSLRSGYRYRRLRY